MLGAKSSKVIAKAGFSAPQDYTGVQRDRFGNTKQDALFRKVACIQILFVLVIFSVETKFTWLGKVHF